ncbi:MAG: TetR/AcrR family transcriptional regulator [Betaproteobacteria bacterium]|nr:TetR/AcrR family transcriptional regulator [Betaproteobacteria bacterium]
MAKPPRDPARTPAPGSRLRRSSSSDSATEAPAALRVPLAGKSFAPETPGKAAETRRQILLAAAGLFREKGYKATTLRDVAELAGMGAGSMYYHFSSKDAILREVLDVGIATIDEAVRAAVAALPGDATPAERLREAILADLRALLETSEYTPAYARIYNQLPATIKRRDHPRRVAYLAYWRELVLAAQRAGQLRDDLPVEIFVEFLVGSMSRTTEWFNPRVTSVDALAQWVADWILQGVERRGGEARTDSRAAARSGTLHAAEAAG